MTWCGDSDNDGSSSDRFTAAANFNIPTDTEPKNDGRLRTLTCPSCGHSMPYNQDQGASGINELPGLPAGVKFDPTDQEILEHLEAKAMADVRNLHPLIDEFIPTLEGENGICYTHPEKLPGVSKDGQIRHFFHRPSKAYTTGTRKRRKVHTDSDGNETRWHKTGKTRPILSSGVVKGFKKILVLYTNYGRQRKPEKTNWVMHQYHLGHDEEEKDGELVASKVFYQTQPRQCGSGMKDPADHKRLRNSHDITINNTEALVDYYGHSSGYSVSFGQGRDESPPELIPNLVVHRDETSSFMRSLTSETSKGRLLERK